MRCAGLGVSPLGVRSEAVRTLDSSLSLYTSAIASRGLHHCVSWRGREGASRVHAAITTLNLRETINIGSFENLHKCYV